MKMYIYEHSGYPDFSWDKREILNLLTEISQKQGKILGKMQQFGFLFTGATPAITLFVCT